MTGGDVYITLRNWLRDLPRGGLAKVARATGIPSARLSLFRRGKQNTLNRDERDVLLAFIRKHAKGAPGTASFNKDHPFTLNNSTPHSPLLDNPPITFHLEYPDAFAIDLRRAENLKVMGTSLRRLTRRRRQIRELVARGGKVQVIFIDPAKEELRRYETIQEFGDDSFQSMTKFLERLQSGADWWFKLKNGCDSHRQQVEIKTIDYPLAFGLDIMDFGRGRGSIYVQFYPLVLDDEEEERPIVEIRDDNEIWYTYYREQFERHWDRAYVWREPRQT